MSVAIISFETEGKVYIQTDKENAVVGYPTSIEAVKSFESMYFDAHSRGYERSMSACMHFITFKPAIHVLDDIQEIVANNVAEIPFKTFRVSSGAGQLSGILCTGKYAKDWHDKGITPELVKKY